MTKTDADALADALKDWCENDPLSKPPYAEILEAAALIQSLQAELDSVKAERDKIKQHADYMAADIERLPEEGPLPEGFNFLSALMYRQDLNLQRKDNPDE